MGLLDGELRDIVGGAVDFLMQDFTIRQRNAGTFDVTQNKYTGVTTQDTACRGIHEKWTVKHYMAGLVKTGTFLYLIMQKDLTVTPTMDDILVTPDGQFTIISAEQDPANATWEVIVKS